VGFPEPADPNPAPDRPPHNFHNAPTNGFITSTNKSTKSTAGRRQGTSTGKRNHAHKVSLLLEAVMREARYELELQGIRG
jgi:hypothetical protein